MEKGVYRGMGYIVIMALLCLCIKLLKKIYDESGALTVFLIILLITIVYLVSC